MKGLHCMVFKGLLYVTLTVFILGLTFRISTWFFRSVGLSPKKINASIRFLAFVKGFIIIVFSTKIFTIIKTLILDVILQRRILKEDFMMKILYGLNIQDQNSLWRKKGTIAIYQLKNAPHIP